MRTLARFVLPVVIDRSSTPDFQADLDDYAALGDEPMQLDCRRLTDIDPAALEVLADRARGGRSITLQNVAPHIEQMIADAGMRQLLLETNGRPGPS